MARVNLLPWREWERRRRRQRFLFLLLLSLVIGIALVVWATQMVNSAVAGQEARNAYLRRQTAELNNKIKTINSLKATRQSLLNRMKVIEQLEQSRPMIVHLFEQLTLTVPDSVFIKSVHNKNGKLTIEGVAQSPAGVSSYMRRIDNSQWLGPPNLEVVRTSSKGNTSHSSFTVTTQLVQPNDESKTSDKSGKGDAQ